MNSLADIDDGQKAVVQEIVGDDAIARRLMEMGLTDGEAIEIVGRAPMGDPIEVAVCGYRLSLRNIEAKRVLVTVEASSAP